jgi:Glycosyl transferase family group 2
VTEDADLGLRLARHGYRTELIETVTEEEPNARPLPWIKQRSRWLKGYAMTWAVHMRDPRRLWRDLGPRRFVGVQIMYLGTVSQYVLAPVLWTFWAFALGLGHPLEGVLPRGGLLALAGLFLLSELLNIAVGLWAVRGPRHRHLMLWVPTLHLYFPLGALASYKALWEAVRRPFFWDKTAHGLLDRTGVEGEGEGEGEGEVAGAPLPPLRLENPILPGARAALPRLGAPLIWSGPGPEAVPRAARPAVPLQIRVAARRPGIEFQPSFEGF